MGSAVFQDGTTIYLVMQPGSAGQQNSSRLVSQFFANGGPKPEIVINPIAPHTQGVAEGQTSKALIRTAYSPISRLIGQMAQPVPDSPSSTGKGIGSRLKGLGRKLWSRISTSEKDPSITQLGLAEEEDQVGSAPRSGDAAKFAGRPAYAASSVPVFEAGMPVPHSAAHTADRCGLSGETLQGRQSSGASSLHGEMDIRTYQGANYVKGADGQWHLQKGQTSPDQMKMEAQATAHFYEPNSKEGTEPEKARAKVPVKRVAKSAAKAAAKRVTKAAAKPSAKASAKPAVKSAAKSKTKSSARQAVKSAAKSTAKASAKGTEKTAATPAAKAIAKRVVQAKTAAAGPVAKSPAHKPEPAKKKPLPASSSRSPKTAKSFQPAVASPASAHVAGNPVPDSAVSKLTPGPVIQKQHSETAVNMPVSESAKES
jgi:hypothetical protein